MIANGYFKGENILPAPGFKLSPSNSHSLVWELTILATFCPVTKVSQLSLGKKHDDHSWHPYLVLQSNFKWLRSIVHRIIKLDSILLLLPDETDFCFKGKREDNFFRDFITFFWWVIGSLNCKKVDHHQREKTGLSLQFFGKKVRFWRSGNMYHCGAYLLRKQIKKLLTNIQIENTDLLIQIRFALST